VTFSVHKRDSDNICHQISDYSRFDGTVASRQLEDMHERGEVKENGRKVNKRWKGKVGSYE